MSEARLAAVSQFLTKLIEAEGLAVVMVDPDGSQYGVEAPIAADPAGFLPVFIAAAEAIWTDVSGDGFGLVIAPAAAALLGFKAESLAELPLSIVALTLLHAIDSVRDGDVVRLNALVPLAVASRARAEMGFAPAPAPAPAPARRRRESPMIAR